MIPTAETLETRDPSDGSWSLTIRAAPEPAPDDLVEDVLAHLKRVLPQVGTGQPFDRAAHRAWIVAMEAKHGGFAAELLAWDAQMARRATR